jgi:hypothetical protein
VGNFFYKEAKNSFFPKYRKNGWKYVASALTLILRSQFLHPDVARAFSPCCGGEGWECEKEDGREKGKMAEISGLGEKKKIVKMLLPRQGVKNWK